MGETNTQSQPATTPRQPARDTAVLTQRFVAMSFCRADILFEIDNN